MGYSSIQNSKELVVAPYSPSHNLSLQGDIFLDDEKGVFGCCKSPHDGANLDSEFERSDQRSHQEVGN